MLKKNRTKIVLFSLGLAISLLLPALVHASGAVCGDGILQPYGADDTPGTADDEQCDCGDVGVTPDPSNNNYCIVDGATVNNDNTLLCTTTCQRTVCGDGIVQDPNSQGYTELCDDGNLTDGDGCSSDCCFYGTCGNGVVDPGEECDTGSTVGQEGSGCSETCTIPDGDDPDPPVTGGNNLIYIIASLLIISGGVLSFLFYRRNQAK